MLTDAKIRSAKLADRAWRLADTGGLFVHVTPAGKKIWRYRYKFEKREKLLTLGHYPGVSLTDARAEREEARRILREGRDLSVEAKIVRLAARVNTATTFEAVAHEWYEQRKVLWATRHTFDVIRSLERDIFPKLGHVPINEITPPVVLAVLRQIEDRGAIETADRIRQRMSDVFVHTIASGCGSSDPAALWPLPFVPSYEVGSPPLQIWKAYAASSTGQKPKRLIPLRTLAQPSDSMPRLYCMCDMKTDHFHSEWT